jgi:large subunit ribosomal protein L25
MKAISIEGQRRENQGKSANYELRSAGYVPCELYGKNGNIHFSVFSADFKDLVYSPETYRVDLNVDGEQYSAIMKEVQFHPLSDEILHVDFHEITDDSTIKIELPIRFLGVAAGVREGGKLIKKLRSLKVKGLAKDMPDAIEIDVTSLTMGKSVKVRDIKATLGLEVMNAETTPVASVEVPRAMKGKDAETAAAPAAAAPAAAAPAAAAPKAAAPKKK